MPSTHEHQRFVAHIDVLGMSALVAKDPELAWNLLSRLVEARNDSHAIELTFLDTAERIAIPNQVQAITFSDTIVLFTKGAQINDLRAILVMATQLLSQALRLCVPIRVGISVGTFFFNLKESMYAGPALIEAYHLGEKAQWIGITTSEDVYLRALKANIQSGTSNVVIPANIPMDGGMQAGYAVNWPVILNDSISAPRPVSVNQVYEGFAQYFGSWESLEVRAKAKYEHTTNFLNQQGAKASSA